MARRKMTVLEAWRVLWNEPRTDDGRVLNPVDALTSHGCGRQTAIDLIRELSGQQALLPHCDSGWNSIVALTVKKEPPREKPVAKHQFPSQSSGTQSPDTSDNAPSRYRTPVSRVVILVDRDNIMTDLRAIQRPFPFHEILSFAAQNGGLEAAFLFTPLFYQAPVSESRALLRFADKDTKAQGREQHWEEWRRELLLFSRHGFQIVVAQSAKDYGGDRVDKALEDMGRLLLKNPDVGTIVILSEDRDFSGLFAFAVGNGKQVFQFRVDPVRHVLRSTDYLVEIPIPLAGEGMTALTTRPKTAWQAARASSVKR